MVTNTVKVPLTDDERAALDDFIYNLGAGNFRSQGERFGSAVAAKVPVSTVAKLVYGGVMSAGSAVVSAPHVAAAWAVVSHWL